MLKWSGFSIALLVAVLASIPAHGATYFVAKTGNDSNPCSQGMPCLTITRGLNVATQPGDIVQVAPGTYNEAVVMTHSGSSAAKITLQGHNGSGCPTTAISDINHPTGKRPNPNVIVPGGIRVQADYVKVDCFRATSGDAIRVDTAQHDLEIVWNYADGTNGGTGINVCAWLSCTDSNVHVADNFVTRKGYGIVTQCSNCTFERNEVFDLRAGSGGEDGDYSRFWGDSVTWRHNYFHGNSIANCPGCHIDCWQTFSDGTNGSRRFSNNTLDGNVCFNAHEKIIFTNSINDPDWHDITITNNLFAYGPVGDANPWCVLLDHVKNVEMYNNTCVGGNTQMNYGSLTVRGNIFYGTSYLPYSAANGGTVTASNNLLYMTGQTYSTSSFSKDVLNKDPLFVNSGGSNYRLQAGSPAINAGATLSSITGLIGSTLDTLTSNITTDLTGVVRDSNPDIGAYEFGGSTTAQKPEPPTNLQVVIQ